MAINSPPQQPGDPGPPDEVERLAREGKHVEAAELALGHGQLLRASQLFERVWEFGRAARAAQAAGELGRALQLALDARDPTHTRELHAALIAEPNGKAVALDVFARARRFDVAGPLAEELGQIERALELYQRGHCDEDAARLLLGMGKEREAARVLERFIELASGEARARAQLQLAEIFARRAAPADAARLLQEVAKTPELRAPALRKLVPVLAAMGMRDGARDALVSLRAIASDEPADLDVFLRRARDAAGTPPTEDSGLLAGRYRVRRHLGSGGAGRVLLAHDEVSGREVAVKVLADTGRGGSVHERFVREAKIAAALHHPHLVEVHEVLIEHGLLVMEVLAGGSLAARLASGEALSPSAVRRLALEVLAGLELAHQRGVVHRDIKPANILFDTRGSAKLGDFGVAHLLDLGQTQTGGLIGSLAYMAPEQITGAAITVAADFYSLGVTLFESLTGRLPFLGPDFVAQHLSETAPEVCATAATTGRQVPAAWDAVIAGLLRKNPSERTSAAGELRRQLEKVSGPGTPVSVARLPAEPATVARAERPSDDAPRYGFETPLGGGAASQLLRAVDRNLDRSVVIERFEPGDVGDAALAHARQLGAVSSPFVQRALAFDRETRQVVFEAPAGATLADLAVGLSERPPGESLRVLKRLARAVAAFHELGISHGQISASTVLFDDALIPTVLLAGLGNSPRAAVEAAGTVGDVAAVLAMIGSNLACETPDQLWAHFAPLPPQPWTAVDNGEALYAWFDALEVAHLRSVQPPSAAGATAAGEHPAEESEGEQA